jgi:hypothetical protein
MATAFPRPSPEGPSDLYELAEFRGRLAQRLYERGDALYALPEDRSDVAPLLFHATSVESPVARPLGHSNL